MKTERLGLIATQEEKQLVVQLARLEGDLSQSALIRRLIHQAAERHHLIGPSNKRVTNFGVGHEQPTTTR